MSWIGGLNDSFNQISSFTGQIGGQLSTFTKEVLAEGADEGEIDYEAEVRRLRMKLIEAEALLNEKEAEISKHVQANSSLQERARTAELEAGSMSHEYQLKLQQQQKIISKLKQDAKISDDGFQILHEDDFHPHPASSRPGRTFSGGSTDAAEFDDVISSQREVNRLSFELPRAREECERWKQRATSNNNDVVPLDDDKIQLRKQIKDLKEKLDLEVERHQHEIISLQETNSATVRQLKEEIRHLRTLGGAQGQSHDNLGQSQKLISLSSELDELKSKLRTRDRQLQVQKGNIDALKQEVDKHKKHQEIAESSLREISSEAGSLQKECAYLETKANSHKEELKSALKEIQDSVVTDDDKETLSVAEIVQRIRNLKEEKDHEEGWDVNRAHHDEVSSINPRLLQPLYQSSPQSKPRKSDPEEKFLLVDDGRHGDEEVSAVGGDLTMTLAALQKQVEDYELEIAQYELVQKEWQNEKESLQNMLDRYQNELGGKSEVEKSKNVPDVADVRAVAIADLKRELEDVKEARVNLEKDKHKLLEEKERLQTAANNLEEELNASITEAQCDKDKLSELKSDLDQALAEKQRLEAALKNVSDELNSSRMEKIELDEAIEALDGQHQEEMNEIIQIRNNLTTQLKESHTELNAVKGENEGMRQKVANLNEKLNQFEQNKVNNDQKSDDSSLREKLESEKKDVVEQLNEALSNISKLEKSLEESQKRVLDAEDHGKDAQENLDRVVKEKEEAVTKATELEEEIAQLMRMLQQQAQESLQSITEAEARVDDVESRRRKMEEEHKATLMKMEQLKSQHLKVIRDLDAFREAQLKSEDEFATSLEEKDKELRTLKEEVALLHKEEVKRKDELRALEDDAGHEALLKNEITRLEERHTNLLEECKELKINISASDKKMNDLLRTVDAKDSVIQELNNQIEDLKTKSASDLQGLISEYEDKMEMLRTNSAQEIKDLTQNHKEERQNLQNEFEVQMKKLESEHEVRCSSLQNKKDELEVRKMELDAKIKSLLEERDSEVMQMHEMLQKSSDEERAGKAEANIRLHDLAENFQKERVKWDLKEKEILEKLSSAEEECKNLHQSLDSAEARFDAEKKRMADQFTQEKEALVKKMEMVKKEKEHFYETRIKNFQEEKEKELVERSLQHQDEIGALAVDVKELKHEKMLLEEKFASADKERSLLRSQLEEKEVEWTKKIKDAEDELEAAQNDVVLMSEHLEQEKKSWKREMTSAVEKMRSDHKEEVMKMQQNAPPVPEAQTEVEKLQESNSHLKEEIVNLKKSLTEADAVAKQRYETKIAGLESEIKRLQLSASKLPQHDVDELLQEIRMRDLSGWEKGDLSKEDISSLLEVIKERDQVINLLQAKTQSVEAQPTSDKGNMELEEKCRELNEERDQILAVISQKTKENRQLKDENQRMLDTVTASQTALSKVQEENRELKIKYEGFDQEMTKETVARLSKLISEKDLEIESLKQKCQTLLDVLQQQENATPPQGGSTEPSVSSQQVQVLLRDRETLSQQVRQLLTERDHLVALVNNKHQEALLFQEEARKASEATEKDAAENSKLQVDYGNLVHDYEQVEMKLNSVQRELARFKEAFNHLEESKEILFSKLDIAPDQHPPRPESSSPVAMMGSLRSDASGGTEKTMDEMELILQKKTESLLQKDLLLQETVKKREELESQIAMQQKDLKEKDILIHKKMEETSRLTNDLSQKSNEVGILRKSVENLREQVASCTYESNLLRDKAASLERSAEEKNSESSAFQETNAQLAMLLKEREYEIEAMREKVTSVNEILQRNEQGKDSETRKYLEELDRLKKEGTSAKHERDQIMLTLKQKQLEAQRANDEARTLRDKESKLQSELTRLRGHLVQVEETYTQEAVLSSDREEALRRQLEQIRARSENAHEASEQSKQQVESLQEQLRSMAAQRDQVIHKLQLTQEQSSQYAAALQQLQVAAERMQREEASMYAAQLNKIKQQYNIKEKEAATLCGTVTSLKAKLDDVNEALESASRLNEQLELKEQTIDRLKEIVSEKQLNVEELQDKLHASNARSENMVDKELVKNLLAGYFSSPTNKQPDVLRLIASVIGFSQDELSKLEKPKSSWVGGWIPWGKGGSPSPKQPHPHQSEKADLNESFSQMFVKFLENESSKHPVAKLPATEMVNEAQQRMSQRKIASEGIPTPAFNPPLGGSKDVPVRSTVAGRYNPFLAPSTTTSSVGSPSSGSTSHPLMLTPILPSFTPVAGVKPTDERDLLQGILQNEQAS